MKKKVIKEHMMHVTGRLEVLIYTLERLTAVLEKMHLLETSKIGAQYLKESE